MKDLKKNEETKTEAANEDLEQVIKFNTAVTSFENKKNITNALINFQKNLNPIPKDSQGYGYNYAGLDTVLKCIKEPLQKAGLAVTQLINGENNLTITTILFHTSGEYITSNFTIDFDRLPKGKNFNQDLGSSITYLKRYCLNGLLSICAEDDQDGNTIERKKPAHANKTKFNSNSVRSTFNNSTSEKEAEAIKKLSSCKNMQELKVVFQGLGSQASNKAVIAHKDTLKAKFEYLEQKNGG